MKKLVYVVIAVISLSTVFVACNEKKAKTDDSIEIQDQQGDVETNVESNETTTELKTNDTITKVKEEEAKVKTEEDSNNQG